MVQQDLYWILPIATCALGAFLYHFITSYKITSFQFGKPVYFAVPGDNLESLNNFSIKKIKATDIDKKKKYKYSGFIAYAGGTVMQDKVYFLLGREAIVPNWSESGKWSDFGGVPNENEDPIDAIAREGFEETMGILGCEYTLKEKIIKNATFFEISTLTGFALIAMLPIEYDQSLPTNYNNIYKYLSKCTKPHHKWKDFMTIPSCPEGYYEKIELKWVTLSNIEARLKETYYIKDENGDNKVVLRGSFLESLKAIWSLCPTLSLKI